MRRVLLVVALVACKSKSEPAVEQSRRATGGEAPGGVQAGSGSAVDDHRGLATPDVPTPIETDAVQPAKGGPRRKDEPRPDPAPATPTRAKPDDTVQPATASIDKPAPSGVPDVGTLGGGQRLPPGTIGFTSIAALDTSTLTVEDAGAAIKTSYQAGLKRCYQVHLATHDGAKGTAKLTFTVETNGRVISPVATSFAPELDACLGMMAFNWRFPAPTDPKTTKPARVRFAVELLFNPG